MILLPGHRTSNAVRFLTANGSSTYIILGQVSAWGSPYSDSAPPPPSPTTTSINQQFCALKATVYLVVEDDGAGTYQFLDSQGNLREFNAVGSTSTFISDGGTLVLVSATASCNALLLLTSSFRQVGVATNLVPVSGHESDALLPSVNISSWGNLETVENRVPVALITDETYNVNCLIQY